jgi:hypothetical protein
MIFTKKENKWITRPLESEGLILEKLVCAYKKLYPNSTVVKIYDHYDAGPPGWPGIAYYRIEIVFNDNADEAEFILKELL